MASAERLLQSNAEAVCPDDAFADWAIVRSVKKKPSEADIRSKKTRIVVELIALIETLVRIQDVVACIVDISSRERRQPRMTILFRNQLGNHQVSQSGLRQAVAHYQCFRLLLIQRALQLPRNLGESRIEDRVFLVD